MKSIVHVALLLAAVLLCFSSAQGQGRTGPTITPPPPPPTRQPVKEMQSLIKALSGRWSLAVKLEPNEGGANGAEKRGEEVWKAGAGGAALLEDEWLPIADGDLSLLGLIWWDRQAKAFRGMECNSQSASVCDVKGSLNDISVTWDGKQLIIEEREVSPEGKKMTWRERFADFTSASFTQTGEMGEVDGPLRRVLTIHAKRVDDHAN